jgi:hypothetical protein
MQTSLARITNPRQLVNPRHQGNPRHQVAASADL